MHGIFVLAQAEERASARASAPTTSPAARIHQDFLIYLQYYYSNTVWLCSFVSGSAHDDVT